MMRAATCALFALLLGCDGRTLVLGRVAKGVDADVVAEVAAEAAAPTEGADALDAGAQDASHEDGGALDAAREDPQTEETDAPNCLSAADCTTPLYPHCDILRLECVACLVDADCDAGARCKEGSGECTTH